MTGGLKPYTEYKESGVPWLGRIPSHWDISPGRAVFSEKQVKNKGLAEKRVLSLSYGRIVVKPQDKLRGLVPESFETYQIVEPGDLIIRATDLQNDRTSLRVGFVCDRGIITSAYLCLKGRGPLTSEFGYLLLHAYDLKKVFYGLGSGLRQNLSFKDIKYLPVAVPPPADQDAAVRFIRAVDRGINRTIRAKKKLIALLNEQKQAIIERAVTQGFDADVRLKPSGTPWLGEVPRHWDVRRTSWLFDERIERGRAGLPILVVSLRTGVTVGSDLEDDGRPRRLIQDLTSYKYAEQGDIAYNMMRMWQGAVGVVRTAGLVSPAYVVARPRKGVLSSYFELVFRTDRCKGEINRNSRGIVSDRNRLYWDQFKRLYLPLPPFEEQKQIVLQLEQDIAPLNAAIDRFQREIDLIREFRTRMIAEVVTGKLDVREVSRTLPAEVDAPELSVEAVADDGSEELLEAVADHE
jgi:type I restriction enzyme S subunit